MDFHKEVIDKQYLMKNSNSVEYFQEIIQLMLIWYKFFMLINFWKKEKCQQLIL